MEGIAQIQPNVGHRDYHLLLLGAQPMCIAMDPRTQPWPKTQNTECKCGIEPPSLSAETPVGNCIFEEMCKCNCRTLCVKEAIQESARHVFSALNERNVHRMREVL